jgi:hypothetical protein
VQIGFTVEGVISVILNTSVMKNLWARSVGLFCVVACATVAAVAVSPDARRVRTEDRNRDGRPDAWRHYDQSGRLTEVALDSNFDGRSDVAEYYDSRGAIVRRESDRNFNGQVDLVEEFEPTTHEHTRSVIDVDYDGSADILVLFRDGQPVFSRQARPATVDVGQRRQSAAHSSQLVRDENGDSLAPLLDPFQSDTAVRGASFTPPDSSGYVGLSTSGGLPRRSAGTASPAFSTSPRPLASDLAPHSSVPLSPRSPRGPPLS